MGAEQENSGGCLGSGQPSEAGLDNGLDAGDIAGAALKDRQGDQEAGATLEDDQMGGDALEDDQEAGQMGGAALEVGHVGGITLGDD